MKTHRKYLLGLGILSLSLLLAACRPASEAPAQPAAVELERRPLVSATGQVIPAQEALLSLPAGGVIAQVPVQTGAHVAAGQVLLQLAGTQQQAAAVAAAELALVNAQIALARLYQDTDLMAAEALRTAETAAEALEDLHHTEQQVARGTAAVAQAESAVDTTARTLATLTKPPPQEALDQAYAHLLLAEEKLNQTLADIADVEWKLTKYAASRSLPDDIRKSIVKSLRQALKGLEIQRTQNQLARNRAETKYHNLLAPPAATDVAVATANLRAAEARLNQAQRDLARIMAGPEAGEVAVLAAQIATGHRDFETFRAGPDPEELALAEAQVAQAATQLAAAQETLADRELRAPFAGVIAEIYVNASEWLTPGSPVLLLADLEDLQIETTDLSEIEVAQIQVGDPATVTFDALPDLRLAGTIIRIAPKADASAGINFPVTIALHEIPPDLRWGMTAFVEIEKTGNE